MTIEIDIEYDEAETLLARWKQAGPIDATDPMVSIIQAVQDAFDNESERRGMEHMQSLMESGGYDDSKYRRDMKDAGRGHLLR